MEPAKAKGIGVDRPAVRMARGGGTRQDVVVAPAKEVDALQEADRLRLEAYASAGRDYVAALVRSGLLDRPIEEAHDAVVELAEGSLPRFPGADRPEVEAP